MRTNLTYGMVGAALDSFIGAVHRVGAGFDGIAFLAAGCFSRNPEKNREAINRMLAGIPILSFDISAGKHFGDILAKSKGISGQDRDKMIAAHCRSLGYTLVTDNIKDFQYIPGINIITWRTPGDI